jgi:hypothetical protein
MHSAMIVATIDMNAIVFGSLSHQQAVNCLGTGDRRRSRTPQPQTHKNDQVPPPYLLVKKTPSLLISIGSQ